MIQLLSSFHCMQPARPTSQNVTYGGRAFLPATPRSRRGRSYFDVGNSICTVSGIVPVSAICLQILNSFNISDMDEATLFKFSK